MITVFWVMCGLSVIFIIHSLHMTVNEWDCSAYKPSMWLYITALLFAILLLSAGGISELINDHG